MQNPPKKIRKIYGVDKGKILVQKDQAGAEALIVAYLCERGNLRALFEVGIKPHVYTAFRIFPDFCRKTLSEWGDSYEKYLNMPIRELPKHDNWRRLAKIIKDNDTIYFIGKKVRHARNYAMKAGTFSISVVEESEGAVRMSERQADDLLKADNRVFPEIGNYHIWIEHTLKASKFLRNLFGYPRFFYGIPNDALFRDAYSFIPQSTVGCITNIALTKLQAYIEPEHLDWDILLNTHDSILMQVPENDVIEARDVLGSFINMELTSPRGERFRMQSDTQVGYNWAPADDNNPDGLREI